MCGRYSLALRPSQVRAYLEDEQMPVYEAPEDDADDAPRQSYNFAPGYNGIVYRADVPYYGAGSKAHKKGEAEPEPEDSTEAQEEAGYDEQEEVRYKLQTMKWGLIPFWTKRNPDYGSMMKTMNCRDDSLIENRGMWTTMKQKKRCIVVCQGFYEWLKKGPKEKVPHYIKRKDGQLMCMAGLWDCVQYEGVEEKTWTYTIITTSSNKQLHFLHDRMPVILENGSEELRTWLDPKRSTWSKDLQSLLQPFKGELEIYPVSKDVGKVGNNSPNFIIPVASTANKSNIANFFAKGAEKKEPSDSADAITSKSEKTGDVGKDETVTIKYEAVEDRETLDHEGTEDNAPLPVPKLEKKSGIKRELDDVPDEEPPSKISKISASPSKEKSPLKPAGRSRSATSNNTASPKKPAGRGSGSQKITNFFGK
ncbi:peptidase [Hyphodiscus hymeniophilus]|uniref:Peptidase n=1 Tax=Hyphodiscus hymeniophilus TaxID=353542 RepID=A0A9P6SNU1_9HELO|nr:peptidase [Hyphodiscus hymeniophilus]